MEAFVSLTGISSRRGEDGVDGDWLSVLHSQSHDWGETLFPTLSQTAGSGGEGERFPHSSYPQPGCDDYWSCFPEILLLRVEGPSLKEINIIVTSDRIVVTETWERIFWKKSTIPCFFFLSVKIVGTWELGWLLPRRELIFLFLSPPVTGSRPETCLTQNIRGTSSSPGRRG